MKKLLLFYSFVGKCMRIIVRVKMSCKNQGGMFLGLVNIFK